MNEPEKILIVAMTQTGVIGRGGTLPWTLPEDLALFKRLTLGQTLLMGRRTYESIGRPLPGRRTVVISRSLTALPGAEVCTDFEAGLRKALGYGTKIFFCGGVEIYRQALAVADTLRISWVKGGYPGNTVFPEWDADEWQEVDRQEYQDFRHLTYRRSDRKKNFRGQSVALLPWHQRF